MTVPVMAVPNVSRVIFEEFGVTHPNSHPATSSLAVSKKGAGYANRITKNCLSGPAAHSLSSECLQ